MYSEIDYHITNHVGIVRINRPLAHNALTHTTYDELQHVFDNTMARCLILTGADPSFCAGDDVKQVLSQASERSAERTPRLIPLAGSLLRCRVPVIAAVNGAAVGWGMEMVLMCDIQIASERAKFGALFVKRGLSCSVAGLARLTQLVGRSRAAELLLTGSIIEADDACRIGLVSRVVPHDDLMPVATAIAQEIADNPPLAVSVMKRGLAEALDPDWDQLGHWTSTHTSQLLQTADHKEGLAAFLEKRDPQFIGR